MSDFSNSFFRFALRCLVQLLYLTPKATSIALPEPPSQPYFGGIIGINILCALSHLYFSCPEAAEANRGYLQGGLMLDFVGQQPPRYKFQLLGLDLIILALQTVALAATVRRKRLAKPRGSTHIHNTNGSLVHQRPPTAFEQDAEERGLPRRSSSMLDVAEDNRIVAHENSNSQSAQLQAMPPSFRRSDKFYSGQSMIAELYVLDTIREQHAEYISQAGHFTSPISPELQAQLVRSRWQLTSPFR